MSETLGVMPGGVISGALSVPGDKSISHRAVMLGALADGRTSVTGCLMGEDVVATINAFRAMGVQINEAPEGIIEIDGVGIDGLKSPARELDLGNSGTSMRLLAGIVAGAGISATLIGDHSLNRRPMGRVADPLASMGAEITTQPDGTPPILIQPATELSAIDYRMPVASAQVKSALILAALRASRTTRITEPAVTRDHTERMLLSFGVDITREDQTVVIQGGQRLRATDIEVPGDLSSAAFFLVGAAITKASQTPLRLQNIGINPTRTGVLDILRLMGATIDIEAQRDSGGEPSADLIVRPAPLHGIEIPRALVPLAIDEFPVLMIAAACAEGTTVLHGAKELRHKESDRIEAVANGLKTLGISVDVYDDGMAVTGGALSGGEINADGDHRIAMAFAIAALRASNPITIRHAETIATSFPGFRELATRAGLRIADSKES